MALQTTSSNPDLLQPGWSSLSGRILEGGFELQDILEADVLQARFKVRVLGDRDLDCVALFFQVSGSAADSEIQVWKLTRELRHPNVSAPLGTGRLMHEGISAIYVVVRRADESLDSVLGERALTFGETGEVLDSVARALELLHLNGLAYGCLAPSRVLAVGESIKLPVECVRNLGETPAIRIFTPAYLAPESQKDNLTIAADLWCLGATIFEALTQKAWTEAFRGELGDLAEPFATIVTRCLQHEPEARASLGEVMALHRGDVKPQTRGRAAAAGASTNLILPIEEIESAERHRAETETFLAPTNASEEAAPAIEVTQLPELEPETTALRSSAASADLVETTALLEPATPLAQAAAALPVELPLGAPELVKSNTREAETPAPAKAKPTPEILASPLSESEDHVLSPSPALVRPSLAEESALPASPMRSRFDEALEQTPVRRSRTVLEAEEDEPATNLWVWAGVTLLVVLALIWILRPRTTPAKPVVPAAAPGKPASLAAPVAKPAGNGAASVAAAKSNAWETRTLQPDGTALKATPGAIAGPEVWRVVAFTYNRREDAEHKARAVNAAHGGLHASVFLPPGSKSPFLVVLGNRMSHDEAANVRKKAIASGLPKDSYIQNYSR